jgi:hypothetical protein
LKQGRRLAYLWAVAVSLLPAHTAWLWVANRIVPDTDILALLRVGERDPVLQRAFGNMVDAGQQRVIVLVGAAEWDQARRAANAYRGVLAPHGELLQLMVAGTGARIGRPLRWALSNSFAFGGANAALVLGRE